MSENLPCTERSNYDLICSALKAEPVSNEFVDSYISLMGKLSDVADGFKKRESADTYLDLCCMEPLVNNLIPYEIEDYHGNKVEGKLNVRAEFVRNNSPVIENNIDIYN